MSSSPLDPQSHQPAPKRHRGGQPGNQNARKHGLYVEKREESTTLRIARPDFMSIKDEIKMFRTFIHNFGVINLVPENFRDGLTADNLRAFSIAVGSLTRMVKTEIYLEENVVKSELKALDESMDQPLASLPGGSGDAVCGTLMPSSGSSKP